MFLKKQWAMRHYHFFYVSTNVKWKICNPYYLFSLTIVVSSPSIFLYETNFLYEGGHSIPYSIFKTCVQRRKDHFSRSVCFQTQARVVKEAKMLVKLTVVNSNHFIIYKCKITHCLDPQTLLGSKILSEFI